MFGFKIEEVRKQMKLLFLMVVLSGLSLSCTREAVDSGSKIKMTIDPSLSKSNARGKIVVPAGFYPMHLVANVHFDGKTALDEWSCEAKDKDNMNMADCAFPPQIDFKGRQFPRGSGRIIQVMLVYGNEEERLIFNYDDAVNVDFNSSDVIVPIGNNWVQQGGGKIGRVGGRHGLLRSGKVEGYVVPPRTGRPRMKLFDEFMFSGWFDLMFFENVKTSYFHVSLADGVQTPLFENRDLKDIESSLTANHAAVAVNIPTFYGVHSWTDMNGSAFESHKGGGESYILGFFDDKGLPRLNGSNFSLKLPPAAMSLSGIFRRLLGTGLLDPINSAGTSFVAPDGSGSLVSESAWDSYRLQFVVGINSTNTHQMTQTHGMAVGVSSTCTDVDQDNLVSPRCIQFEPTLLKNRGLIPFEGPFQAMNDNGRAVYLKNSGVKEVSWRFLPGVAGNSVHGLALFILDGNFEFRGDHYPCMELAKNAGVSGLMDAPTGLISVPPVIDHVLKPVASSGVQGSHDFGAADLSGKQAVACPWVDVSGKKFFYPIAAKNHGFWGSGEENGGAPMPVATHVELVNKGPMVFPYLNQYSCTPLEIRAVDSSGNPASLPNLPHKVNLNVGLDPLVLPYGYYFYDPDCSNSVGSGVFELHSHVTPIWFKPQSLSGGAPIELSVNSDASETVSLLPYGPFNPSVQNNPANKIITWGPMTVFTSTCSLFEFLVADVNGVPAKAPGTGVINVNTSPMNGTFFYHGQCGTGPTASLNISGSQTSVRAEFRPNTPGTVNIATGNSMGLSNAGLTGITAIDPGPAEYAILEGSEYITTNVCAYFEIATYKNISGYGAVRANTTNAYTHTLNFPPGFSAYQSNYDCENMPGNAILSVAQAAGTSSQSLWLKATNQGTYTLNTNVLSAPAFNTVRTIIASNPLMPMLVATPTSHDFGPVTVGTSADFPFTIQNTGTAPANDIYGMTPPTPFSFKGGSYPGTTGTCGGTLNVGQDCTVVLEFTPTVDSPFNESIQIEYSTGSGYQYLIIPVSGYGNP